MNSTSENKQMNKFSFALPSGYDWEVKTFVKNVKTKKWATQFKKELYKYSGQFVTSGNDHRLTLKTILTSAYGVNIDEQVFDKLSNDDIVKIKNNIIAAV